MTPNRNPNRNRRQCLRRLSLLAAAPMLLPSLPAAAQGNPQPVTLVVPFSPGGPTDAMARTLANALKPLLGQSVLVDNRPGAGGNIGAEVVARAAPNGNTLLFGTSGPLAINVSLYSKMGYDPIKSFAPVIRIGHLPNVLVVHPGLPARNVSELIAYAKANPGKLSYASSGNGASSHLAGVLFNMRAGTDIQHVPYKGTGPALNDLLGGQVSMAFTDVLTALPHIKAGKLRILGVTSATRSKSLPEVPAGTPPETIQRLNAALAQALNQPEVRQTLEAQGLEIATQTRPEQLGQFIRNEVALWREVVKASGAQLD